MRTCLKAALLLPALIVAVGSADGKPGFSFRRIGPEAGLTAVTVFGGKATNRYLLETTGSGVAMLDFDNDGHIDLLVTYFGRNRLYHNNGRGAFDDVSERSGVRNAAARWGTGCAFLDYDRDGLLDMFIANYIDLDLATAPTRDSGLCKYKGVPVACGPPGLKGGSNVLLHNRGDGSFADVSDASGITKANGSYGLGVSTLDFDNDGWIDLYVANDSNPSALYRNRHDGTFEDIGVRAGCAYSQDGKPQAGMGVGIGDFDRNGWLDILKTNFAGDTTSLYANTGGRFCEDRTFDSGLGLNSRWLGWGAGFADFDNDGWLDIFLTNGHVYPEVRRINTEAGYEQRKVVYRNVGGQFEDVTERLGPPATVPKAGRGTAFGDLDNNGTVDVAINNVHETPDVFLTAAPPEHHWLVMTLVGTVSNRSAIGARIKVVTGDVAQLREVQGGGSYISQNDLRVHVGLGAAAAADRIEVRWPNGREERWLAVKANRLLTLTEGQGQ